MKTWHRFSIRTMIILVAACTPILLVVRMVHDMRMQQKNQSCSNRLKNVGLALIQYSMHYGSFPPAYIADTSGKPMHSWRLLVVPFLDDGAMRPWRYNRNEPWDSPNNITIANTPEYTYTCHSDHNAASEYTSYVALVGPGTIFPGAEATKLSDVGNRASTTILLVEIIDSDIRWTEPRDLDLARPFGATDGLKNPRPGNSHGPRLNVIFADGHLSTISQNVSLETLEGLARIGGAESISKGQP